jgi:hypothetical protein
MTQDFLLFKYGNEKSKAGIIWAAGFPIQKIRSWVFKIYNLTRFMATDRLMVKRKSDRTC